VSSSRATGGWRPRRDPLSAPIGLSSSEEPGRRDDPHPLDFPKRQEVLIAGDQITTAGRKGATDELVVGRIPAPCPVVFPDIDDLHIRQKLRLQQSGNLFPRKAEFRVGQHADQFVRDFFRENRADPSCPPPTSYRFEPPSEE